MTQTTTTAAIPFQPVSAKRSSDTAEVAPSDDAAFIVPRQYETIVRPLIDGGCELVQEGQFGGDQERDVIHVSAHGAVAIARNILLGAGFPNITITVNTGWGDEEVNNGNVPGDFDFRPPAPPVVVKPAPPPEPKNDEPEIDGVEFKWDRDSVALERQDETAVYRNPHDDVVIRQARPHDSDDAVIIVLRSNTRKFIEKLTEVAGVVE
jgi:hypothetical protein